MGGLLPIPALSHVVPSLFHRVTQGPALSFRARKKVENTVRYASLGIMIIKIRKERRLVQEMGELEDIQ